MVPRPPVCPQSAGQVQCVSNFASEIGSLRSCHFSGNESKLEIPGSYAPLLEKFSRAKIAHLASRTRHLPEAIAPLTQALLNAQYHSYSESEIDAVIDPIVKELRIGTSDLFAFANEERIQEIAAEYAHLVQLYCTAYAPVARTDRSLFLTGLSKELSFTGVELPFPPSIFASETATEVVVAALARLHCERWWRRQVRKICFKQGEAFLRKYGGVGCGISPYLSRISNSRVKSRQQASEEFLLASEIESDLGEIVPMADIVASSLANPKNRLSELYVRARGFDQIAEESNLRSYMITITTPSRFHVRNKTQDKTSSYPNAKFDGATPEAGQIYLRNVWAKIRAKLARDQIHVFGIRVAEAHHDGTPHWHLCVHVSDAQSQAFIDICRHYACEDTPSELFNSRRMQARFDVMPINPEKGSPRSYLFKYLTKNLIGSNDISDESGAPTSQDVNSVQRWASLWGIRQFQVFGSPSVTVWRELRRLREKNLGDLSAEEFEQLRDAACTGDWARFVSLMGGVCSRRDAQPVRPEKVSAGENQYGELIYRIKGLVMTHCLEDLSSIELSVVTRDKSWRLVPPGEVSRRRVTGEVSVLGGA
ncbi:replication endonuclease [Spongiibacter sp.]|uniref:replication endonuclease n=1 Tax=Spongiibacter sp. TaxID=2024860 RepID=UPI00257D5269|nr:replication endonuclease [Spongiibacter sp.]